MPVALDFWDSAFLTSSYVDAYVLGPRTTHCIVRMQNFIFSAKQVWIRYKIKGKMWIFKKKHLIPSKYHTYDNPFQILPWVPLGFRGMG